MLKATQIDDLAQHLASIGYVYVPRVVDGAALARLRAQILGAYERARNSGGLFAGGGTFSGHLNCFPGEGARFVFDALRDYGLIDVVRRAAPEATRLPNVGCNLNLPGSSPQNVHVDGYAAHPFMVINVAGVDTRLFNGAMEVYPRSHRQDYKYWEFALARFPSQRVELEAGDVLIRTSALWHRGMPNQSTEARPMIAFSWEDGGSRLPDPFRAHDGIRFFPNRYGTNVAGMMKERAFTALPRIGAGYRFVRSMLLD